MLGVVVNSSTAALNLTCSVRETIRGLTSSPSAQWLGPVNGSYDDKNTITQYLNDSTVIITASFSPPQLIHAGMYQCVGTVQTSVGNVTASENITVTFPCEWLTVLVCLMSILLLQIFHPPLLLHFLFPLPRLFSLPSLPPPVPPPPVSLAVPSGTLYEGTSQILICSVSRPPLPQQFSLTDVTVEVDWYFNGALLRHFSQSAAVAPSNFSLLLDPLSLAGAGQYSCRANASATATGLLPGPVSSVTEESVIVAGMCRRRINILDCFSICYIKDNRAVHCFINILDCFSICYIKDNRAVHCFINILDFLFVSKYPPKVIYKCNSIIYIVHKK